MCFDWVIQKEENTSRRKNNTIMCVFYYNTKGEVPVYKLNGTNLPWLNLIYVFGVNPLAEKCGRHLI